MEEYRVLIVDDERAIRDMIVEYLKKADEDNDLSATENGAIHFLPVGAETCADARARMCEVSPSVVILDVMLPDGDGFLLFQELRQINPSLPVLFLSARDEDAARLKGLGLGADDYITKPFLLQELKLRLEAVCRRVYGQTGTRKDETKTEQIARIGTTTVDLRNATARIGEHDAFQLTAKEFLLFRKLYENRGNIVTIDALCDTIWGGELIGYENTLMVHVRRLREKIEEDPSHPKHLVTVRGLGYRLNRDTA